MKRNSYLKVDLHDERYKPLLGCDELAQEVRNVENAPTWRRWWQQHPYWYICCPYSDQPFGNRYGLLQGRQP